jgi:hypothetical protein
MEFLLGRSLTNNITNLLLAPFVSDATRRATRDWLAFSKRSPTRGSDTAGSDGWRHAFSTRWPRRSCQRWDMGCATSRDVLGRRSTTAGSRGTRTTGSVAPTHERLRDPTTGRDQIELFVRNPQECVASDLRPAIDVDRPLFRSVRGRGSDPRARASQKWSWGSFTRNRSIRMGSCLFLSNEGVHQHGISGTVDERGRDWWPCPRSLAGSNVRGHNRKAGRDERVPFQMSARSRGASSGTDGCHCSSPKNPF